MGNENIKEYYDKLAATITDAKATRNKAKDFTQYDVMLMKQFADPAKVLLDLGSGTGLLINNLADSYKRIIAVEKYPEFSKFIVDSPTIEIINADILQYTPPESEQINVVSLFGVMNYFDRKEATVLYEKIYSFMHSNGVLIVKNQMGINDDVVVNGLSEELQTNYYSEYRHLEKEIALLKKTGFKDVEVVDIYPPEYNRWNNTHFYALVCRR